MKLPTCLETRMSTPKHTFPEALLSGLLADYKKPEDLIGENGLLKQLTKLLAEKALDAELAEHLGEHDTGTEFAEGRFRDASTFATADDAYMIAIFVVVIRRKQGFESPHGY
jgi:hypothetical protein